MVQPQPADVLEMTDDLHEFLLFTQLRIDLQLVQMIEFFLLHHQYQLGVVQAIRFEYQLLERMLEVLADIFAAEVQGIAVDLQFGYVCEVLEHAFYELIIDGR